MQGFTLGLVGGIWIVILFFIYPSILDISSNVKAIRATAHNSGIASVSQMPSGSYNLLIVKDSVGNLDTIVTIRTSSLRNR